MAWSIRSKPQGGLGRGQRGGSPAFDERNGTFHQAWENKFPYGFPEPGAQAFAYESLALVEMTPIGAGAAVTHKMDITEQPMFAGLAVPLQGIPLQAGGVVQQPLFDPDAPGDGYTVNYPQGVSPLVAHNIPVSVPQDIAPNMPYPETFAR